MLQQSDFIIEYRPGASHQNADTLSRFPLPSEGEVTEARLDTVSALTLKIEKRHSDALAEEYAALHGLNKQAPFADETMPSGELFISH